MRLFLLGGLGSLFANFSKLGPDRSIDKKKISQEYRKMRTTF